MWSGLESQMHDLDRLGQLLSKECMKTNGTSFNRGLLASGESKLSVCPPVHLNKLPALHNGTGPFTLALISISSTYKE